MTTPQAKYRAYLESLSPATLDQLSEHVTADIHFRDPFNDTVGIERLRAVFVHMFENVRDVRFRVIQEACNSDVTLWHWHLSGILRGKAWDVDGTSVLRFDDKGLVNHHTDYWDAAAHFYERLPVIGRVLRRIRKHLAQQ